MSVFKNCVLVEPPQGNIPFSYVTPDFEAAGYLATKHLISLDRKRISILQFGADYRSVQDELTGYKKALAESGLYADPSLIRLSEENEKYQYEAINQCVVDLLRSCPDAVAVPNDGIALWVIRIFASKNLRIPQDMAVVSLDGWDIGQVCMPSITSIDSRPYEVGRCDIEMVIEDIERPEDERKVRSKVIEPRLIVAESSGAQLQSDDRSG